MNGGPEFAFIPFTVFLTRFFLPAPFPDVPTKATMTKTPTTTIPNQRKGPRVPAEEGYHCSGRADGDKDTTVVMTSRI